MADDAPVKRKELERALRHLNMSDADVRDALQQPAAVGIQHVAGMAVIAGV